MKSAEAVIALESFLYLMAYKVPFNIKIPLSYYAMIISSTFILWIIHTGLKVIQIDTVMWIKPASAAEHLSSDLAEWSFL